MKNQMVTSRQIAHLDKLFGEWEGVLIQTDEDLMALASNFDDDAEIEPHDSAPETEQALEFPTVSERLAQD